MSQTNWFSFLPKYITKDFARTLEIPHNVYNFSTQLHHLENFMSAKKIPDGSSILFSETDLLLREISLLSHRLEGAIKFNVIDLYETTGGSCLPVVYEFLKKGILNRYVPATINAVRNRYAIKILKDLVKEMGFGRIKTAAIDRDVTVSNITAEIRELQKTDSDDTRNLFVLNGSSLGNQLEPEVMLEHIYNSMNEGDYLLCLQGIYRCGTEDDLVKDYTRFANTVMGNENYVASNLNQDYQLKVSWDDQFMYAPGIVFTIKIDRPIDFGSVELNEGKEVTIFRSSRFPLYYLQNFFWMAGFHILEIAMDRKQANALILAQK